MADPYYLYWHIPELVFKSRTNMPGVQTYPLTALTYDTVTLGAFGDIQIDQTILLGTTEGGDDLGRVRVQGTPTSTSIPIGRISEGTHDGELTVVDNAYITVIDEYRVWAKTPFIDTDGTQYKDSNIAVGVLTDQIPPVANCGPSFAGFIDSVTSLITVQFVGTNSFAVAAGATISTYLWDVDDGTITVGTSASNTITATFPEGVRWVKLAVTDSNGKTHLARCLVVAIGASSLSLLLEEATWETLTIEPSGQTLTLRVMEDIARSTYPDGAMVLLWRGAADNPGDRSHMHFIGWHQVDEADVRSSRTGTLRGTQITCVDVAGRLAALPGYPQSLELNATPEAWTEMVAPTMDRYLHYILHWHSTALALADYFPSNTGDDYPFVIFASEGQSLYEQVSNEARALVPTHQFTCNRRGQLSIIVDPMLQDTADRTSTVMHPFTEDNIESIRFNYTRPPRTHWVRASALLTATGYTDVGGVPTLLTVHGLAPGSAPGQGVSELVLSEGLAQSQADLNAVTGHRYARENNRYGLVNIVAPDDNEYTSIDPATLDWVALTITSATAAQRGLIFATVRAQVKEMMLRFESGRTGQTTRAEFTLEIETIGKPALTIVPEGTGTPDTFVPPLYGDPSIYYGNMKGYILWDGAHVMRTWDIGAASPTWELVDTGITGTILDGQYVHVDADTVGMWLLTDDAVWWCADIMAVTPSWASVLTTATVTAGDADPGGGLTIGFGAMFNYASEPGYLIVATSPTGTANNYIHAYSWHTHDYGQNWTQVDMPAFTYGTGVNERGYPYAARHGINIYRSSPGTIWMGRFTSRRAGDTPDGAQAIFKSVDLGHTWTKEFDLGGANSDGSFPALLNPFPSISDPSYLVAGIGDIGVAVSTLLYISSDAWATGTLIAEPTGYGTMRASNRVNKRTFDNTHVMGWFKRDASTSYDLLESFDQGTSWSVIFSGTNDVFLTPNGWPPDVLQWVAIRDSGTAIGTDRVRLTYDNFANLADKKGNLASILPGGLWTPSGNSDGFSLPRTGVNV